MDGFFAILNPSYLLFPALVGTLIMHPVKPWHPKARAPEVNPLRPNRPKRSHCPPGRRERCRRCPFRYRRYSRSIQRLPTAYA